MGLLFDNNKPDSEKPVPFSERKFDPSSNSQPKGFLDTLFGKKTQANKKPEEISKKSKSILEKRQEGLTRSELRTELKRVPYDQVKMYEKERVGVEQKMEKGIYGENINLKDVDKYIKDLRKKESLAPTEKERLEAKHKRILLEKIKEKKIQ